MDSTKKKKLLEGFNLSKDGVTQSMLKTFLSCRVKFALSLSGLSKKENKNVYFGSVVHELLDIVYSNREEYLELRAGENGEEDCYTWLVKKMNEYLHSGKESNIPKESKLDNSLAVIMVFTFFDHYDDLKKWKGISTEDEFSELYKGVRLRGKIDGKIRDDQKKLWHLEHKTKSRINEEDLLATLKNDFQNLMYSMVLKELRGEKDLTGTIYNIIRKPALRQGKAETDGVFFLRLKADIQKRPDFYFMRYEINYSDKDFINFKETLDLIIEELKLFIDGKLYPLPNVVFCLNPFKCEFLEMCTKKLTTPYRIREKLFSELDNDCKPFPNILKNLQFPSPEVKKTLKKKTLKKKTLKKKTLKEE